MLKFSICKAQVGSDKELAVRTHEDKDYGILQVIYVDGRPKFRVPLPYVLVMEKALETVAKCLWVEKSQEVTGTVSHLLDEWASK